MRILDICVCLYEEIPSSQMISIMQAFLAAINKNKMLIWTIVNNFRIWDYHMLTLIIK